MVYVYDSSFVGSLIITDEKNTRVNKLHASIGEDDDILVPQMFWYEITNIFMDLIRRKRYTYDDVYQFFSPLAALRLVCDNESGINYASKLLRLCDEYNISSYDAAYLELAERKKAVLCTMDENLKIAAKKYGVSVIK
ncbi:MAG: type II toxin-antitoxin system VapC family toxin [Treponema sp.]|jgi:predicted nucleic acid-binding protein|nr:type II toxin-antitoxin system VapC family toxin [Treponema sp.]